jgi:hypothetical protein
MRLRRDHTAITAGDSSNALTCILYARCSTRGDAQDPAVQLAALRLWAATRGWRVIAEESDRVSGDPARRVGDPPALRRAPEAIEQRRADLLAVFAADRLVRSPVGLLQLVARVQAVGGHVLVAGWRRPGHDERGGRAVPVPARLVRAHGAAAHSGADYGGAQAGSCRRRGARPAARRRSRSGRSRGTASRGTLVAQGRDRVCCTIAMARRRATEARNSADARRGREAETTPRRKSVAGCEREHNG